jgi:hypothetical protein
MNIDLTQHKYKKYFNKYIKECVAQLKRRTRNSYSRVFLEHLDGSFFKFSKAVIFLPHFITPQENTPEQTNRFAFVFSTSMNPIMFFREDLSDIFESPVYIDNQEVVPRLLDVNIPQFYDDRFDYKNLNHTLFIHTDLIFCYLTHAKHVVVNGILVAITEHNGCVRFPMREIKHFSSGKM